MKAVAELTWEHWKGTWDGEGQFHSYNGKIPIVATTLELLREHGPAGPAFWRFGRDRRQCLVDAIGNPRMDAALARRRQHDEARRAAYQAEQQRKEREQAAVREARRPVCAECGATFPDGRWKTAETYPAPGPRWRPTLCAPCEDRTLNDELQAEQAERERQELEEVQKSSGWLSRFRG